jgi:hypothetical protein
VEREPKVLLPMAPLKDKPAEIFSFVWLELKTKDPLLLPQRLILKPPRRTWEIIIMWFNTKFMSRSRVFCPE